MVEHSKMTWRSISAVPCSGLQYPCQQCSTLHTMFLLSLFSNTCSFQCKTQSAGWCESSPCSLLLCLFAVVHDCTQSCAVGSARWSVSLGVDHGHTNPLARGKPGHIALGWFQKDQPTLALQNEEVHFLVLKEYSICQYWLKGSYSTACPPTPILVWLLFNYIRMKTVYGQSVFAVIYKNYVRMKEKSLWP